MRMSRWRCCRWSHVYERYWTFYVLYRGAVNVYIRDPQAVMSVLHEVRPT